MRPFARNRLYLGRTGHLPEEKGARFLLKIRHTTVEAISTEEAAFHALIIEDLGGQLLSFNMLASVRTTTHGRIGMTQYMKKLWKDAGSIAKSGNTHGDTGAIVPVSLTMKIR